MKRVISSPCKFVIGNAELEHLADYIKPYGDSAVIVALAEDSDRVGGSLKKAGQQGITLVFADFAGECSYSEVDRICEICSGSDVSVLIGLGGGKAIDTAKVVAHRKRLPLIVVPTIASTDAPCSALAIMYDDDHVMCGFETLSKNPDVILADSKVVAQAPVRFLIAGIGDAFATYFEARACERTCANNYVGGKATKAAMALARLCHETLLSDSLKAIEACKLELVTPALENIIEANLLLSGIGFESGGCAAAHALHNALTVLPETHAALHGEKVAIGLLVQLIMENAPSEEMAMVLQFYRAVGLPTTLAGIGIKDAAEEKLRLVAQTAAGKTKSSLFNHPFPIDEDLLVGAFKYVGRLNELY